MQAMNEIGVTGITITNVMGCGVQKGAPTYYRGVELDMNLRPKVKIEIVVSLVPVQKVIDTAKEVLHTGQIGDGKSSFTISKRCQDPYRRGRFPGSAGYRRIILL